VSSIDTERPLHCTREAGVFRLAFRYDPDLVSRVKALPFAAFDPLTKTWTTSVCSQSLDTLRTWRWEGLLDVDPDSLISPGEEIQTLASAVLASGTTRRPYIVRTAVRDEQLYSRLIAIPGARWEKAAGGVSYPAQASVALAELVDRGIVEDPHRLLQPAAVTVAFNVGTGSFVVRGDTRAAASFDKNFPHTDVMALWRERGLDVAFADTFSEEMYRGELARVGTGIQPTGMQLSLYPYQQVDLGVVLERSGVGVFSAMGVGKTALAIAAGHELMYNRQEVPRVIVIVPPAVRSQWRAEIIRFTGCQPDEVVVVDGDKKKRLAAYDAMDAGARWLIVHYQAVILPEDKKRLERLMPGALLIADECHRVKNKDAKTSKVVWALGKSASRRIGLSGTPVENNPGEWFNVLSGFLVPGVFGSPIEFLNRYCYPGKFGYEGARNIPELRKRSKPLYVRHTLSEIASHLPPLRVQTLALDPKPEYQAALKRAHREAREEIKRGRLEAMERKKSHTALDGYDRDDIESGAEMTAVGLLKLMCCSPRLVALSDSPSAEAMRDGGLVPEEDGPKLDELRVMCAEMQASNERVVVFTSSKRMAYLVSERFVEDGIRHVMYTGDTNTADRDAAVAAFTGLADDQNDNPTVFVSTDAGAEGLNLGRHCSTLVNLDIPWTPGRLAQRNARVRRVDSTASGFLVVNLVVRGTLEEGILRMVEHKADLADAVFGETGGRRATTGRGGRNIFEEALEAWAE
jgi:superfamily II DNA or RNA helicase